MKKDFDKYGPIIIAVTKDNVLSFDHSNQLGFLQDAKRDAQKFEDRFSLMIMGYDDDPREVWEIEEIRQYFQFFDRCFPYWFYFLDRKVPAHVGSLGVIASLVVPIKTVHVSGGIKQIEYDEFSFNQFMDTHFNYLKELLEEIEQSTKYNSIFVEIERLFTNVRLPKS